MSDTSRKLSHVVPYTLLVEFFRELYQKTHHGGLYLIRRLKVKTTVYSFVALRHLHPYAILLFLDLIQVCNTLAWMYSRPKPREIQLDFIKVCAFLSWMECIDTVQV